MKKLSKILCALLVLAMLCSSLAFMVSAADTSESTEEEAPVTFKPSVSHTKDDISSVNSYISKVKDSTLKGNLYGNTSSFGNSSTVSSFLSLMSSVTEDNSYLTFFAESDGTVEKKNPFYQLNTTDAPNVSLENGTSAYYVVDFDIASQDEMLSYLDVTVMLRRVSDDSGFPFSTNVDIKKYITDPTVWSHVTIVGDIAANQVHLYINGKYVATPGYAYNENEVAGNTQLSPKGIRINFAVSNQTINFTKGQSISLDNLAQRVYTEESLTDGLAKAVKAGDLSAWSGYHAGFAGMQLPAIASVDGVEYGSNITLAQALSTNDPLKIEFLSKPIAPVSVNCNATINTNGMNKDELFKVVGECQIKSEKDNIIITTAPFVSNVVENPITINSSGFSSADVYNTTKYDHEDNLYTAYTYVTSGSAGANWGTPGFRNAYFITDTASGESVYRESATLTDDGGYLGANEYVNMTFTSELKYEAGKNEYIVVDLDCVYERNEQRANKLEFTLIPRKSSGYHSTGIKLESLNLSSTEFSHLTIVYDLTNNAAHVFVNGNHVFSQTTTGAMNANGYSLYKSGTAIPCKEFKMGSHTADTIYLDNVLMRMYDLDESNDEISAALTAGDITSWSDNVYNEDYEMARFASIATVDGVPYYSKADLDVALYGNRRTPAVVKVLHEFSDVITVSTDAKIYTYGQNVKFVDADGNELVPVDEIINYDAPYISNREDLGISITNGINDSVTEAIKAEIDGNLFDEFIVNSEYWGVPGYRDATLVENVDTNDVMYYEYAIPNADGSFNCEDSYSALGIQSAPVLYEDGKSEYLVADFEYTADAVVTDSISFVLVSNDGTEILGGDIYLKTLNVIPGKTVHISIVYDLTSNNAYIFFDGMYYSLVKGAAMSADGHAAYLSGSEISIEELRLASNGSTAFIYLDNVAVRFFDLENEENELAKALEQQKIKSWSGNVYNADYEASKLPPIAIIDGLEYGSIELINQLLAVETGSVKNVEILHDITDTVKILTDAVVETNGLSVNLDCNTGLYKFKHNNPYQVCTGTDYAYASNKLVCTNNVGESIYRFTTINTDNCMIYATPVIWFNSIDPEDVEVVFYIYGDLIHPIYSEAYSNAYVENGKLYTQKYHELSSSLEIGAEIGIYPTANKNNGELWFYVNTTESAANFAATDLKYGAYVSSGIVFTLYVNKSETVTDTGKIVKFGDDEYVAFEYCLAPDEIDEVITVKFEVQDSAGNVYEQRQKISFVEYAASLLESGDDTTKKMIASLLNYANESHALFNENGEKMAAVSELLETYAHLIPTAELGEKLDTSALSGIIRSAYLRLNTSPEFVFKVAKDFAGTIQFSYTSLGETVTLDPVVLNTFYGEQTVVLDGFNAYDIYSDIIITVTEDGSDTPIVCTYNLATYAKGLGDNNAFALALYSYSKAAEEYKSVENAD